MVLQGTLVGIEDGLSQNQLVQIMMLDPADLFRLINLSALDTTDVNGVIAVAINSGASSTQLFVSMGAWILAPLFLVSIIFKKKTL